MQLLYIVQCTMYQLSNCMGLEFMHNAYKVSECFHCTPVFVGGGQCCSLPCLHPHVTSSLLKLYLLALSPIEQVKFSPRALCAEESPF